MNQMQLDAIVRSIECSFGEEMPFAERPLTEVETESLNRVFADSGYQRYLQDQTNRQIIRDYLTNAIMLGFITTERLAVCSRWAESMDGRAALSLHMLMTSIENANDIALESSTQNLTPLRPRPGSPPHMVVVKS